MQFKNEKEKDWLEGRANNTDPYGNAIFIFAEKWADLMEKHIRNGKILTSDDIKKYSNDADEEGITGFMYGRAVAILANVWLYGNELRKWHNRDTQINHEGDKANDNGGVLNPALLHIN
jgi:hypothetical protein